MSYYVTPYLVNAEAIEDFWGSDDSNLVEAMREQHADALARLDADFGLRAPFQAEDALSEIAAAELTRPDEYWFVYVYVYEILCGHFGEAFPIEDDLALEYLDGIDPSFGAFIDIPCRRDFPHVLSIRHADLPAKRELFLEGVPDGYCKEDLELLRKQLTELFDLATERDRGLVLMNY